MSFDGKFLNHLFCLALLTPIFCASCQSAQPSVLSTDNHEIPSRRWHDTGSFQYRCEPLYYTRPKDVESLLNQYGRQGWQSAGFLIKDGQSIGFCVYR